MAIANKYKRTVFEENINKALAFAERKGDQHLKYYLLGFMYDHFVHFVGSLEEKIKYLSEAKENYYRAGQELLGQEIQFRLSYYLSKRELKDGHYAKSIDFFKEAMSYAKYAKFPNIISSLNVLQHEKCLHEFYLHLSRGEFVDASKVLGLWLTLREDLRSTRRYKFFEVFVPCCKLLGQNTFVEDDLIVVEKLLQLVREKRLSLNLYRICSLVHAYVTLGAYNVGARDVSEKIRVQIISSVATKEVAVDVEQRLEVQRAIEKRDWLLRLPPLFAEKFDECLYFLNDVLEGDAHLAWREFYTLLENFVRVVVRFNAKILWQQDWELKLVGSLVDKKPFEKRTLGDLVQLLKVLKGSNAEFCRPIPDGIIKLLDQHVEIRNSLAHEFSGAVPERDIVIDTSQIMFSLLPSFPTCLKIIGTKRRPWYGVAMQWNQFPKRALVYSDKELRMGDYFAEPMLGVVDNKLNPLHLICII